MKFFSVIILLCFSYITPSWSYQEKPKTSVEKKSYKKFGQLVLSIHDANGTLLTQDYGLAIFRGKKLLETGSNQSDYTFVLPVGLINIEVYSKNETSEGHLATYKDINVLVDTILHKKLFINHQEVKKISPNTK